jgi:hypothetical protein
MIGMLCLIPLALLLPGPYGHYGQVWMRFSPG